MGKQIIPLATHPSVALTIPMALSQYRILDIKEIENPDKLSQILKQADKLVDSTKM